MQSRYAVTGARWVFGLFYFATGIAIVLGLLGFGSAPQQPTPASSAFAQALDDSRFINPLLAVVYLVGGGALLLRRTAPLGIAILTPVVIGIFCFHITLSGQWIWGTLNLGWLLSLIWCFRSSFRPLWNNVGPGRPVPQAGV